MAKASAVGLERGRDGAQGGRDAEGTDGLDLDPQERHVDLDGAPVGEVEAVEDLEAGRVAEARLGRGGEGRVDEGDVGAAVLGEAVPEGEAHVPVVGLDREAGPREVAVALGERVVLAPEGRVAAPHVVGADRAAGAGRGEGEQQEQGQKERNASHGARSPLAGHDPLGGTSVTTTARRGRRAPERLSVGARAAARCAPRCPSPSPSSSSPAAWAGARPRRPRPRSTPPRGAGSTSSPWPAARPPWTRRSPPWTRSPSGARASGG